MPTNNLCMCSPTFIIVLIRTAASCTWRQYVCSLLFLSLITMISIVSTPPPKKWCHPTQCWPLNFVSLSFVHVTLGFKDWRAESDTRETFECAYTHAIDGFGMHSPRVNRVTSSASCSVLKLSTLVPCATYQDIYMILGVLCQCPLLTLKPWHLFALPVAMKMV